MSLRDEQRNRSRQLIVDGAVEVFSELGFQGGTTREIATRANTTQGLVTHHFPSKEALWQAATDQLFLSFKTLGLERLTLATADTAEGIARELIRDHVRIAAGHSNLFRILVGDGNSNEARVGWVVDTHIKPLYDVFGEFWNVVDVQPENIASAFFIVAGAASMIFAIAGPAERLTGVNPTSEAEIDRHADFLARVLIPPT
jgi:TetR/AcrR family transcriptional regulator